jgi:hypothetical protein
MVRGLGKFGGLRFEVVVCAPRGSRYANQKASIKYSLYFLYCQIVRGDRYQASVSIATLM